MNTMSFRHAPLLILVAACSGEAALTAQDEDLSKKRDAGAQADATTAPDASSSHDASVNPGPVPPGTLPPLSSVFVIVLENHSLSQLKGSASAPYFNNTLLKVGAHAENYKNPPANHPSEPNYIWMEAGDNLGVKTDIDPSASHSFAASVDHLTAQLEHAGKSWKSYQEDISGAECPIASNGLYAAKHNPMVFFQDVSGAPPSAGNATCIAHVRPFAELASDLAADKEADYNFITPNLCDDMHGASGCPKDLIKAGDDWLAAQVPQILASEAFKDNGVLFITWDESEKGDFPIGMIAISPHVEPGFSNSVAYTHSSLLRTVEDIFALPHLRDAANASNLSDLFDVAAATPSQPPVGGHGIQLTPDGHSLPDSNLTPGVVLTTDLTTICASGYSSTVRSVNSAEKSAVAASYNFTGASSSVEYDHLISLELGGSNDAKNLWPEPIADAHIKDRLENHLHALVCAKQMTLADAQTRIATDWVQLWKDVGQP